MGMNIKILDEGLQRTFQTCDLALATTLSFFCPIERIDKTDPKRAYFIFKKTKTLDGITNRYWQGKIRVDPQRYFFQVKLLKSRLYDNVNKNGTIGLTKIGQNRVCSKCVERDNEVG